MGPYKWVLTVPWARRWLLARNPALARGVRAVAMRRIERWYAEQAGRPNAKGGSISVQQRFGSALGLHRHYHCISFDGVYPRGADDRLSFRYLLRPPLARDRVERHADGTVELRLKRIWSDGTQSFLFSPMESVERLAASGPPPRVNQVTCRGVLAAHAGWRREVIVKSRKSDGWSSGKSDGF